MLFSHQCGVLCKSTRFRPDSLVSSLHCSMAGPSEVRIDVWYCGIAKLLLACPGMEIYTEACPKAARKTNQLLLFTSPQNFIGAYVCCTMRTMALHQAIEAQRVSAFLSIAPCCYQILIKFPAAIERQSHDKVINHFKATSYCSKLVAYTHVSLCPQELIDCAAWQVASCVKQQL